MIIPPNSSKSPVCCAFSMVRRSSVTLRYLAAAIASTCVFAVCPSGFTGEAENFCYAVVGIGAGGVSWTAARDHCRALGGNLASMRSATQKTRVVNNRCAGLVPATGSNGAELYWWLGLNDEMQEGTFTFVSGASTSSYWAGTPGWYTCVAPALAPPFCRATFTDTLPLVA